MALKRSGLGKGLDAIFIENDIEEQENIKTVRISKIEPNRNQPRKDFDDEALEELATSIAKHGVLQPLLVRPIEDGGYQIIAGERRWRASKMAGITEIPVIIKEMTDSQVMEVALIENLQREDLSPVEEAKGYKQLMDSYGFTQEEISKSVGKSRPSITNSLRLLNLPEKVLKMIEKDEISAGHARTLLSLKDEDEIKKIAEMIKDQGLSVRQTEAIVKKLAEENKKKKIKKKERLVFFDEVEANLREYLGRKVKIKGSGKKKGVLQIEFYGEEDLSDLAKRLGKEDIIEEESI